MTTGTPDPYDSQRRRGTRPRHPGSRPRALALAPLLIAAWALLEIWLLTLVGHAAGGLTVFLVIVAGFLLGGAVIKRAGRRAWERLAAGARQEAPSASASASRGGDALTMLGGLLLMVPGPASGVLGLLCVFPPTARLVRGAARSYLSRRAGPLGDAFQGARTAAEQARMRRPDGRVVRGEVIDEEEDGPGQTKSD